MDVAKIVNDYVRDDSFLYFRCRLIAEGKDIFNKSITNPDSIAERTIEELEFGGEDMLYVSDNAFIIKFGKNSTKELPRDVACDFLDYNFGYDIKGEDWIEEELPSKYPKLWGNYQNVS